MDEITKILLNTTRTAESVNVNTQFNISMENTNKPIPVNDINTTVNAYEVFEKERKESSIYRFYGVLNGVISNPVYNDNVKIFENSNTGVVESKKISSSDIYEKDGWIGYFNDETNEELELAGDNESSLCEFFPFDPGYKRLSILDSDGSPNYLMKITYPYTSTDITLVQNEFNISLKDGLPIIEKMVVSLHGRDYVAFKTPINHGLQPRDLINLYNFYDLSGDLALDQRSKAVFKLGDNEGKNTERIFVLDINPLDIDFQAGVSTIKRIKNNYESSYYVRVLKSLTTGYTDYDLFPAAFGVNYYEDDVASFNFIKDIDIEGLKDNLGRPLSELFLTIVKNDNDSQPNSINNRYWHNQQSQLPANIKDRFWTPIMAGYVTENNPLVNYNIRAIGDPSYGSNSWFTNIDESNEDFHGDIVEYNGYELLERSLENIYHRINTVYREYLGDIKSRPNDDPPFIIGNKREGYIYQPHSKIKIREFSSFIHPTVDLQTVFNKYNITSPQEQQKLKEDYKIPDYATQIVPNVYKWRDLLEIGEIDGMGSGVDYPFESGAHYLYLNNRFYFQRQDPPCNFYITAEEILIPQDKDRFEEMINRPTFYKYDLLNIDDFKGGQSSSITQNGVASLLDYNNPVNPIKLDVRFFSFFGVYELGIRDVAGACIDYNVLDITDIDENC